VEECFISIERKENLAIMLEMEKDNAIEVKELSKCYTRVGASESGTHELWALRNVSFTVKRGDSVGIFGHNGSGKSTLLKVLAGVTKPTRGTVAIRGRVASILDIGAGFHPELSGRENIYLNSNVLGFSKREASKLEQEIIEFSGIGNFINEPVKNYSSGMFLRLAFSILAHLDFDVYLFDEVFAVGDATFEAKVSKTLRTLIESEKTVVLVSHQMSALERQSSFLHLSDGVLQSFDRNREVLTDYLTASVITLDDDVELITTDTTLTDFSSHDQPAELELLEVKLSQPQNIGGQFRTDMEFVLEMVYEHLEEDCSLDCIAIVSDIQENIVFFTTPLIASVPSTETVSGKYRLRCVIPASLFNSRVFALSITFLKNTKDVLSPYNGEKPLKYQDFLQSGGVNVCCIFRNLMYFNPVFHANSVCLDLSRFNINCNLSPAFAWFKEKV